MVVENSLMNSFTHMVLLTPATLDSFHQMPISTQKSAASRLTWAFRLSFTTRRVSHLSIARAMAHCLGIFEIIFFWNLKSEEY